MAISPREFNFLRRAQEQGFLPQGGAILEFGESEAMKLDMRAVLSSVLPDGAERDEMMAAASHLQASASQEARFGEARLLYRVLFAPTEYTAIDLEPRGDHRIVQDLNEPFDLGRRFDVCINNGTSEHLFNQANFYKCIHDHTRAGGIMIHFTPCIGWIGHGFFNVQPGFFHDLARENEYEILLAHLGTRAGFYDLPASGIGDQVLEEHPALRNALACVVLRKGGEASFRTPLQGVYSKLRRD